MRNFSLFQINYKIAIKNNVKDIEIYVNFNNNNIKNNTKQDWIYEAQRQSNSLHKVESGLAIAGQWGGGTTRQPLDLTRFVKTSHGRSKQQY
jgi:hypothetical protein